MKLTPRELEIIRRFRRGETIEDLAVHQPAGWKHDVDDEGRPTREPLFRAPPFDSSEVNAALRKVVNMIKKL